MAPPPTPPSPLHKLSFVNATPPELDIPPMPQQKAVKKMSTIVNKGAVRKMRKPEARSPAPPRVRPAQQPQSTVGGPRGAAKQSVGSKNQPPANAKRDIEKRMAGLQKANEKLREKGERLVRELGALRDEENLIEQERDRLQQLWMCSRSEIEDERDTRHDMERAVQRMKTHHEATITQLRQKMRSLLLAARSQRVSETQTELVYVGGPFEDREVQTVEELTRDRANVHLRENDAQLVKLLDEMEREKLNAQSDLKYAIVQLEQRMREENDNELRRLRDEKLRQLEEISTMHAEELRTLEEEVIEQSEKSAEDISRLQDEVARLEADRDELRIQLEMSRGEAERAEDDAARCRRDKDRIEKDHSKLLARSEAVKRDAALMDKMKREVAKYRDINEILMSEYSKLEDERDALVDALDRGVTRLESINKSNNYRLRDRLDEIDKRL